MVRPDEMKCWLCETEKTSDVSEVDISSSRALRIISEDPVKLRKSCVGQKMSLPIEEDPKS